MTQPISSWSSADKIGSAMRRSLPHLLAKRERSSSPCCSRRRSRSSLRPLSLGPDRLIGVGEIVDLILLGVGVVAVGWSVFDGAGAFLDFATTAIDARTEADLDRAGDHFARAVTLLGISTLQALLLRGAARPVIRRGVPRVRPIEPVGPPPSAGNRLQVSRPATLGGNLGITDAYGAIQVARDQSLTEQRLTLLHELVHRYFSPRTGQFLRFRASLNMTCYARSALLRYTEEALAEGYAQLRVNGLLSAVRQVRFPLQYGYVTVGQLATEGQAIGTITLGGMMLQVTISPGTMPAPSQ